MLKDLAKHHFLLSFFILDDFPYNRSRMLTGPKYMKKSCFSDGLKKSRATFVVLPGMDRKYRVRCLPYFMLLGMAKSGTSDFQSRILNSNYVFKGFSKELYWWDQYRFNPNATLSDYSDLLDFAVKDMIHIQETDTNQDPYWPGVVGEMTTITLPDVAYWREDPRNAGLKEPKFITPHDIYPILPKMKLIVLMRNPLTRLYSHYNMWAPLRGYNKSPEDFHMRVVNSMKWWQDCLKILPLRGCLYGSPPEMPEVEHTLSSWWPTNANHSGEFRNGLYFLFLKDWLSVFPRENFLFLRSEDYNVDKLKIMNDEVYPFLGLPKVEGKQADRVENMPNAFQVTYDPMLPETREILHNFYQPYNDQLAVLLGEDRWSWREGS